MSPKEKYRINNREKIRESSRKYREKNKELINSRKLTYKVNYKNTYYKCKYGITYEYYKELLLKQNNTCAICFKEETTVNKNGKVFPLCVDHCHSTGKVRGLLCRLCNSALGKFQDNAEILQSAINYLHRV